MEGPIEEAEHEYEDEVMHDFEKMEPAAARRLSSEAAKKKIVVETLKKMHSAQKVFEGYQQEKARLVRKAFIEFSVVGVVALAVFLAAAAVALRTPVNNIEYFPPNFEGLVLGCIDADFCK